VTVVLLTSAAAVVIFMAALWLLSVRLGDASIVDIGWGLGFVLVAAVAGHFGAGLAERRLLLLAITTIWGLRLASHLWLRWRGAHEDFRYRLMRNKHGDRFWIVSLVTVFGLQGLLMWVVSLPIQLAAGSDEPLGWVAAAGVVLWAFGVAFETVADSQLRRFRAEPANRKRVLDTGLWRWTRHPNYFGDCCAWWGIWLTAAETAAGRFGIVGPIVMTVLLTRVSGVPMLEHSMAKRRPDYTSYVQRTSSFIPRPPRQRTPPQGQHLPHQSPGEQ